MRDCWRRCWVSCCRTLGGCLPFNVASHLCCKFGVFAFFRVLGGLAHHNVKCKNTVGAPRCALRETRFLHLVLRALLFARPLGTWSALLVSLAPSPLLLLSLVTMLSRPLLPVIGIVVMFTTVSCVMGVIGFIATVVFVIGDPRTLKGLCPGPSGPRSFQRFFQRSGSVGTQTSSP